MAEVWLAERTDGLLKRDGGVEAGPMRASAASTFAERLHRERDILAGLAHPGIARLYDAGIAEGGRPYLRSSLWKAEPDGLLRRAQAVGRRAAAVCSSAGFERGAACALSADHFIAI